MFFLLPSDQDVAHSMWLLCDEKETIEENLELNKDFIQINEGNLEEFIPITETDPFDGIDKLDKLHLCENDGILGGTSTDENHMDISRDNPTGQWSEPRISE